jgi:pyridoxamine-phosphate oxidase
MIMSIENTRTQYTFSTLDESDLSPAPHKQLEDWLKQAEKENIRDYNTCCIATASKSGEVSVRNVLLRQLTAEGLVFYTNRNSEKAQQIFENPQGEILFFWRELNRQVRARGKIVEVDRNLVNTYFQSRPIENQQATAASEQSQPIESRALLEQQFEKFARQYCEHVPTPNKWTGFQLQPTYWEFWQGRANRLHDRLCYLWCENNLSWEIQRLQP